jgi:hypothetical protein
MVRSYFYTCCCWCSWVFRVWILITSRVVCFHSLLCYVCVFLICSFSWFPILCSAALYCSYTDITESYLNCNLSVPCGRWTHWRILILPYAGSCCIALCSELIEYMCVVRVRVTLQLTVSQSVSQSVSIAWCRAQSGAFDQRSFLKVTVLSFGGTFSDKRSGL